MTTDLVRMLCSELGYSVADLERVVSTAPRRYKEFRIRKKSGRGFRDVAQPSRELKRIQRLIVAKVLNDLPVHACAHGYVVGRGVGSNAAAHRQSEFILKMDFADFFHSIRPADLRHHLSKHSARTYDEAELRQLELALFWLKKGESALRMCIGAPSSPFISNTIMYDLDCVIQRACADRGVCYTRYADDLTFSAVQKGVLAGVEESVIQIINKSNRPRVRINSAKTLHISKAQRRTITGVNVTPIGALSIGRERKRLIRAMAHRHLEGKLDSLGQDELVGLLGFANDIEPAFAEKMWVKLKGAQFLKRSRRA